MAREIQGIVQKNPIMLERCCLFALEQEEGSYLIVSTDLQACKDNIFVKQGQEVTIRGSGIEDMKFKGVLITEQAKIRISKEAVRKAEKQITFQEV